MGDIVKASNMALAKISDLVKFGEDNNGLNEIQFKDLETLVNIVRNAAEIVKNEK